MGLLLPLLQLKKKKSEEQPKVETAAPAAAEVPAGVEIITMPRLSDTMTEGKVAKWHKNVGDTVKEGDLLARDRNR